MLEGTHQIFILPSILEFDCIYLPFTDNRFEESFLCICALCIRIIYPYCLGDHCKIQASFDQF